MHNASFSRFVTRIRDKIVGAGKTGISRTELNQSCRTKKWTSDQVKSVVAIWEEHGLVESFEVNYFTQPGPKATMIRATQKLITDWDTTLVDRRDEIIEQEHEDEDAA